ncbi:family 20 glycosylhydrolase [Microbacterium esteraromaticum]|uniref:Family 20 glycosylhydrolase n=1 Tax=Microbacterium esteraromaticum TaxID=57043 RepID=A0A7D8ADI4_9MICO|nr:family 20 glycosylhydrolase [Microbacterium esteraromaticum]QMU96502.1 family 20 glycosylhydrolase [Microbacterium esteraromaticum]
MTAAPPEWLAIPQPSAFAPAGGSWRPAAAHVVAGSRRFDVEARRLQQELACLGIPDGDESRIVLSEADVAAPSLIGEAFAIHVADDIEVRAATPAGAFRATRQLLHNLRAQGLVPTGRVESAPAVAERGIHLDAARKHYSAEWIIRMLHDAADVGINVFQWHFSENEGFRLESVAFPEVVSPDHITRAEAGLILETARDLHIDVVPSLDMPGHLRQVLSAHPDLRLPPGEEPEDPAAGGIVGTDHALDITRDEALEFARRLVDDMADAFPHSTKWNLGGDEFVAFERIGDYPALTEAAHARYGAAGTGFDLLTDFVNAIATHLRGRGLQARAWNDGMLRSEVATLHSEIVLTWWTNWHASMRPVAEAVAAGHRLVNVNDSLFYYVLGENAGYRYPTAERIWDEDWHPGLFPRLWGEEGQSTVRQEITRPYPPTLLGCSFAIWSDRPQAQTAEEVAAGIRSPLRAMAERAWNGGSRLSLADFQAMDARLRPWGCGSAVPNRIS